MTYKLNISKLKSYHIILLGSILGIILVLNSNYVNNQKLKIKVDKEQKAFFDRLISKRKLDENQGNIIGIEEEEEWTETEAVCYHASVELKEYYNTSDLSKIDLDDGAIKCEDADKDYMKALISIIKNVVEGKNDDDKDEEGNNFFPVSGDDDDNSHRYLRNLLDSDTEENIKIYGNRILPILIFLCFSILTLFGWIICCFCNCCNCCCCCCCKKVGCKIPCFIITYLFYALVIAVCVYGLTQTNKIFTGLSNTECSLMQFFDQILFGEEKDTRPKWIGIENVRNILTNLNDQVSEMSQGHLDEELDIYMENIDEQRENFLPKLKDVHKKFYEADEKTPKQGYYIEYKNSDNRYIEIEGVQLKLEGKYVLDLIPAFGKYDDTKENEDDKYTGLNSIWNLEISEIDRLAGDALKEAQKSFKSMLTDNLEKIEDGLNSGTDKLDKLRKPFNNVYNKISGALYDTSEYMNDYGETAVKYVFGALAMINVVMAISMFLICLCSGPSCVDCCCCRCICKCSAHLGWNILALFTIITFLVGSLLALIGRIGGDMMSLVSFVVSEDNFNNKVDPILIDNLGSGRDILEECVVGEGNLSKVFNLDEITGDFDTINQVRGDIQIYKQNFTNLAQQYPAYYILKAALENKTKFAIDTNFIHIDVIEDENKKSDLATSQISPSFVISEIIKSLNNSIGDKNEEKWNQYKGDKNFVCNEEDTGSGPSDSPTGNLLHPWTCEPIYRGWLSSSTDSKIKNYAQITTDAINILKYASNNKAYLDNPSYESYFDILDQLKLDYKEYLDTFIDVLDFFQGITNNIINIIEDGIGNSDDTFSFLNGKFIKTNLKIILKYLKYSLGKDIYTVGICLIIVGCSLIFSISMTILLIVIINIDLENNKKLAKDNNEIEDFPVTNNGRVVRYKY